MKQLTEDYVSFEVAKLLKEKGFNPNTLDFYDNNGQVVFVLSGPFSEQDPIPRPSLSLAMKWLREVHHYYVQVMLDSWACGERLGYFVVIQKTDSDFEIMLQEVEDEIFYRTYEEACEAAIKYCLENLI